MDIVFAILLFLIIIMAIGNIGPVHQPMCLNGHKWSRDDEGLICSNCKKRPGQL